MSTTTTTGLWILPQRHEHELGARPTPGGTLFRVRATTAERVAAVILDAQGQVLAEHPLTAREDGLFEALVPEVGAGARYKFRVGDDLLPDPYGRWLPDGPHGAAVVWKSDFRWQHPAPAIPREQLAIYELHVGTFSPEGTFQGAIAKLPWLKDLGVTAIELMPVAGFPGARGWGYDGVSAFSPFPGYGSPDDLAAFVDAAHGHGLAVILDAVFNHLGPDGNYLHAYDPGYFTDRVKTPWGDAPDFRNPFMRRYVLDAAAHWLGELRFDGLRLDATHAIHDDTGTHILAELAALAQAMPQRAVLFAEDDRNDPGLVRELGLDGVWADDFHHHVHVLLTGEHDGYYAAYDASVADLARTIQLGWFYEGQPWPATGKPRGKPAGDLEPWRFVYALQNHDQVGNRALGDRLPGGVDRARWRAATALLLFLPQTPLLFQGQEWGATTPFPFFSDHAGELGEAVTRGRLSEFSGFSGFSGSAVPDPQAAETFASARLDWEEASSPLATPLVALHRDLLRLRREDPVLAAPAALPPEAGAVGELLWVRRRAGDDERLLLVNFGSEPVALTPLGVPADARVVLAVGGVQAPAAARAIAADLLEPGDDPVVASLGDDAVLAPGGCVILALTRLRSGVPGSTYRLQLHEGFPFAAAGEVLDYLQDLGVSDVYTSPYLVAEPGSTHGYNVQRHDDVNPELGGQAAYRHLTDRLRLRGLGHVLDMVPNHMGIAGGGNAWWQGVLENGPASLFADHFDIEWDTGTPGLANKVLLPILGDQYGNVLERGELRLGREGGRFFVAYWDKRLPVTPETLQPVLAAAAARCGLAQTDPALMELLSLQAALRHLPPTTTTDPAGRAERAREKEVFKRRVEALCAAEPAVCEAIDQAIAELNTPAAIDALDVLLRDQAYRLAFWRVATEEINYRRFFDINELAALRMERPEVFEATHALILRFIREGRITGLRLDHTDGLYDPLGYFERLQEAAGGTYVVAEKILEGNEHLPRRWPIHGTTGYDFMALVGGLWVDPKAEKDATALWQRFGGSAPYGEVLHGTKRLIMRTSLSSEIGVLAQQLERVSEGNRRARDFTLAALKTAIVETIAAFPVYRTYIREDGYREELDDAHVEAAIRAAKRRNPEHDPSVFDFLRDVLLLRFPADASEAQREATTKFALKFQQVTSPVMAKGAEDTAFYRYHRLACLNEVGGDPARFGTDVATFHAGNQERQRDWPGSILATATHDHKRGEDTRARMAVLSELLPTWRRAVGTWSRVAKAHGTEIDGEFAPSRADQYLFYQVALGAWPVDGNFSGFTERMQAYMQKATKEAKVSTSWINPVPAYDEAVERFVAGMLADGRFKRSMDALAEELGAHGATNGLAQVLLKLAAPGVPDTYQGCELWDQTLVDPDNRRPVDFHLRRKMLAAQKSASVPRPVLCAELLELWEDGAVKLYVTQRALAERSRDPELFRSGGYRPLAGGDHVVAFARELGDRQAVVVAPRLTYTLTDGAPGFALGEAAWGDRMLAGIKPGTWRNVFTDEEFEIDGLVRLADLFARFPLALLVPAA